MVNNSSGAPRHGALVGQDNGAGAVIPCGLVISAEPFNQRSPHLIIADFRAQAEAHPFEVAVAHGVVRADCLSQLPVKGAVVILQAPHNVLAEVVGKVNALLGR